MKHSLLTVFLIALLSSAASFGQQPSASPVTTTPPGGASLGKAATSSFVPAKLSYQGLLTSTGGAPVQDGRYGLRFEIYNLPSGGALRHTETLDSISVQRGAFSVILHPAETIFSESLYVAVTALYGPGIISPLTFLPRSELTSAPYALNAKIIPPLELSGNSTGSILSATNAGNGNAITGATGSSLYGTAGVAGFATHYATDLNRPSGVYGNSTDGYGIGGISQNTYAVVGLSFNSSGVRGEAMGSSAGVSGQNFGTGVGISGGSLSGHGVQGNGGSHLNNYGGYFTGWGGVYAEGSISNAVVGKCDSSGDGGYFTSLNGTGVYGASSGIGYGGYFSSVYGIGVYGSSTNTYGGYFSSGNGHAVYGTSSYGYGGYFTSTNYRGIYVSSPSGWYAGYLVNRGGSAGAGLYVDGTLTVTGAKTGYVVDFAVNSGPEALETGDVVTIVGYDQPALGEIPLIKVRKAQGAENRAVAGVVDRLTIVNKAPSKNGEEPPRPATQSELTANGNSIGTGNYLTVVTLGSFKMIKADASNGAIQPGDLLVSSPNPGYAMRSESPKAGSVIGKALGALSSGTGAIPVLVTLH